MALLAAALDLLFPPSCAACDAPAWDGLPGALCRACASRLPAPEARCPRCGCVLGAAERAPPCVRCEASASALDGVVAAFPYAGVPRRLVLALKYAGRPEAAPALARGLAEAVLDAGRPGDLVVPVPLSARRRRERGHDQARELARRVARATGLDSSARALVRRRHTAPQVLLVGASRRRGPRGAFRARAARVRGRCVLLVDDVLTTGATAESCARALKRAGALAVVAAVACRTESREPRDGLDAVRWAAWTSEPRSSR